MCNNQRIPCSWVFSEAIAFDAATNTLTITIPEGSYDRGYGFQLLLAQNLPAATTINALVEIAIGDGTVTYPLQRCDGVQVTAAALRYRYLYPVRVATGTTSGAFVVQGGLCCAPVTTLSALTGDAPAAPAEGGGA